MKRVGTVVLGWALTAGTVQPAPAPPVGGLFAGSVLLGEAPLTQDALPNGMSMADRLVVVTYLDRRHELSRRFTSTGGRGDAERQRVALEIASTIVADGIEESARALAASLSPTPAMATSTGDPWGGGASWAENAVRDASHAAARPWLYAFLASRYRLQFEGADENRELLERLAKKYKTMLDRIRNAGDPLFVVLANDLDNRASLSPGVTRHPRQYLPDT